MKLNRKNLVMGLLSVAMLVGGCGTSTTGGAEKGGADYPKKPVNIVVSYKAGGGTDVGARILAAEAQEYFSQPLIIVNKPGADGEIGYTELVKAKPDGYTLGFINLPTFVSLPLQRQTQYSKDDVIPILNHVYDPGVIVVRGDSKWETIEDFIEDAKANAGALTVANNGTGASNHIGAAHFALEAGIELTHVPFGGSADMLAALRGNHVNASVAKVSEVANLVKNGDLRILASYTEERLEDFQDVPTLRERGIDVLFGSARALVAPKDTPEEIVEMLHDAFKQAIESDSHMEKAKNADLPIKYMSGAELQDYMDKDELYLKEVVPQLNLE